MQRRPSAETPQGRRGSVRRLQARVVIRARPAAACSPAQQAALDWLWERLLRPPAPETPEASEVPAPEASTECRIASH
jgi:hypothetical protein